MAAEYRARSLGQALRYKGRTGMWTWVLHRVTGLGILLFLIIHVADTATVAYWPDFYDHTLDIYRSPLFRVAELAIAGVEKEFGRGAIMRLAGDEKIGGDVPVVPTGSIGLDVGLGIGGYPRGRSASLASGVRSGGCWCAAS